MLNARALAIATVVGTILQVAMVVLGHSNTSIAKLFAAGGMGISLVAGLLYAWRSRGGSASRGAVGGLIAGGVCAFIGILLSHLLGDVPASLLLLGTLSSMITGSIGAWLGKFPTRTTTVAAIIGLATLARPQASLAQTARTGVAAAVNGGARIAAVADFAWLVGAWEGEMASGIGTAYVVYAAPHAGLMTGVMHLVSKDNKILVVELIALVDTPRGVEMRFRHFSPQLAAYETEFQQAMLLTSHDASADVFENQVPYSKGLMSTQARVTKLLRQPGGSFIGTSDIIADNGQTAVIAATYRRARPAN